VFGIKYPVFLAVPRSRSEGMGEYQGIKAGSSLPSAFSVVFINREIICSALLCGGKKKKPTDP